MAIDKHKSSTKSRTDFQTYGMRRPRWCPLCIHQNTCANSSKQKRHLFSRFQDPATCMDMELISEFRSRCKSIRYMPARMLKRYLKMLRKRFKVQKTMQSINNGNPSEKNLRPRCTGSDQTLTRCNSPIYQKRLPWLMRMPENVQTADPTAGI